MNVVVHRQSQGVGRIEQRIRQVGDQAGMLAARHVGGRMPLVEIVLTDRRGVVTFVQQADAQLAGKVSRKRQAMERIHAHWTARPLAGTTLTANGVLVAIDATRHGDLRELDRTLIHELAHCVQLAQPGARERHIAYLRQQYGITTHSNVDERAYHRLMDIREEQAENLEVLAKQLPKGN